MGPHTLLLRQWSRTHLYRSPRSSLSESALAPEICSRGGSCSSSFPIGLSDKEREWSACSHSGYCGHSPFRRNVMGSLFLRPPLLPRPATSRARCSQIVGAYSIARDPSSSCLLRALGTPVTHLSLRQVSPPYSQSHSTTTPATHSRGDVSVAGVGVGTVVPPPPTLPAVHSIIFVYGGRRQIAEHVRRAHTPATRSATITPTPITSLLPLLRLPPHQESLSRRHRAPTTTLYTHHE